MIRETLRDILAPELDLGAERLEASHPHMARVLSRVSARLRRIGTPDCGYQSGSRDVDVPAGTPTRIQLTPEEFGQANAFYSRLLDGLAGHESYPQRGPLLIGDFPPRHQSRDSGIIDRTPEDLIELCNLKPEWDALPTKLKEVVVAQLLRDFNFMPSHLGEFGHMKDAAAPRLNGRHAQAGL